jgi:hypothetical protein
MRNVMIEWDEKSVVVILAGFQGAYPVYFADGC